MRTFTFGTFASTTYGTVTKITQTLLPPLDVKSYKMGKSGYKPHTVELQPKQFNITYEAESATLEELRGLQRTLAQLLYSEVEKQLIFSDEPALYYNAMLTAAEEIEQRGTFAIFQLQFTAFDPLAYSTDTKINSNKGNGNLTGIEGVPTGGIFNGDFSINSIGGSYNAGEIWINPAPATYTHPNGTVFNLDRIVQINTALESTAGSTTADTAYIAFIGSDKTRIPDITSSLQTKDFITLRYVGGAWYYDNNTTTLKPITLNANDAILAKITREIGDKDIRTYEPYFLKEASDTLQYNGTYKYFPFVEFVLLADSAQVKLTHTQSGKSVTLIPQTGNFLKGTPYIVDMEREHVYRKRDGLSMNSSIQIESRFFALEPGTTNSITGTATGTDFVYIKTEWKERFL